MTCESESIVAATLANGGVCPTTDDRVVRPDCVKNVLSLMLSCGLYNYSGDFAFKVRSTDPNATVSKNKSSFEFLTQKSKIGLDQSYKATQSAGFVLQS